MPDGVVVGLFGLVPVVLGACPELLGFCAFGSDCGELGAVPGGVFDASVAGVEAEPVVPVGVPDASGAGVDDPLPDELDAGGDDDDVDVSAVVGGVEDEVVDVLPVDDVDDGFDIELSVFGASCLLHAPSAATVATMATQCIERFMR